jgi:hypothetical protein
VYSLTHSGNRPVQLSPVIGTLPDLLDEEGREGLYLAATAILKEPVVTGPNFLKERPVMTWTCPAPE